jgi:hypothetical protein
MLSFRSLQAEDLAAKSNMAGWEISQMEVLDGFCGKNICKIGDRSIDQ